MPKMISIYDVQADIGEVAANILKQKHNGSLIYISKNPDTFPNKKIRNRSIRNDFHRGLEISDLEEKYDLKRSQIYKIVNEKQDIK